MKFQNIILVLLSLLVLGLLLPLAQAANAAELELFYTQDKAQYELLVTEVMSFVVKSNEVPKETIFKVDALRSPIVAHSKQLDIELTRLNAIDLKTEEINQQITSLTELKKSYATLYSNGADLRREKEIDFNNRLVKIEISAPKMIQSVDYAIDNKVSLDKAKLEKSTLDNLIKQITQIKSDLDTQIKAHPKVDFWGEEFSLLKVRSGANDKELNLALTKINAYIAELESQEPVQVCDPATVSNGLISAYPECVITCNTGFHKDGNACVADVPPPAQVCNPASVENGQVSAYPACTITCNDNHIKDGNSCILEETYYQNKYSLLNSQCNEYEDDYSSLQRKYERAIDENDDNDAEDYEEDLDDLKDNVDDLKSKISDLINEVEDKNSLSNQDNLVNKLENLLDDTKDLKSNIIDTLSYEKISSDDTSTTTTSSTTTSRQVTEDYIEVEVQKINPTSPATNNIVLEEPVTNWDELRTMAWLIGGIVVLVAIIVFLLGLLLR